MLSWLTGRGSKSNLPEPTALQSLRSRQIEQLKAFNQNVSEIQRDLKYRVNLIIHGTTVSLYITLPPQFPQDKPVVKVSPRVSHPWVNDQMLITGAPGINNFVVHSDLGKVIYEIVKEFQQNPPVFLPSYDFGGGFPRVTSPSSSTKTTVTPADSQPQNTPYPVTTTTSSLASGMSQPPSVSAPIVATPAYQPPSVGSMLQATVSPQYGSPLVNGQPGAELDSCLSQISGLSKMALMELLEDEDKLLQVVKTSPEVTKLVDERETLTSQNEQMARDNLAVRPILEEKKKSLLEKYDVFNEVKQTYDANCKKQDEMRRLFDQEHIRAKVRTAAMEAEEKAENIADLFLEGKITIEDFKKTYMETRTLSHLRKTKEERLGQTLSGSSSRGNFRL